MIQRIQSVYLALAIIAIALLFAFPLCNFYGDLGTYSFSVLGVKSLVPGANVPFNPVMFLPLLLTVGAIMFLLALTILKYRNRILQIKLINIIGLLIIALIAGIFFGYIGLIEKRTLTHVDYRNFGVYLPMIALALTMLANRAVKRDEKIVRSADRLR